MGCTLYTISGHGDFDQCQINVFDITQHDYARKLYAGDRNGAKGGRGGSGGASATRGRSGVRSAPRESGEQGAFDVESSGGRFWFYCSSEFLYHYFIRTVF